MSTGGGLTFLSWVRTGLVSTVRAPANAPGNLLDASLPPAASLPVTLSLDGAGTGTFDASLVGPGDVIGLDGRQVIRCDPAPGAVGVPPNGFACVELDRPDLPWMLTPGAPAAARLTDADPRRGLRPWLCLVVVPDLPLEPPTSSRPLPKLTVSDAELPDLETAWLWAHAQVLTDAGEELSKVLADHPERTLSRLVAPRRLRPATTYLACVVPTFEAGRRAGLGLAPGDGPLSPAWKRGASPHTVELPVYHAWRFSTAHEPGDFEELAKRILALRLGDAGLGRLDVGQGGAGLPGPRTGDPAWEVPLEGVLVGDLVVPGAWPGPGRAQLQAALAARLAPQAGELSPPTYGALQGGYRGALPGPQAPRWLCELNLDPRYRVMASLGTRVVQRNQEALAASAWEQTAAMREANRVLRQAQLARAVGEVLDARVRAGLAPSRLLQLTAPVHDQLAAGAGGTVAAALARSAPVSSAVSVPFRRAARPRGPLARRLAESALPAPVARLALDASAAGALRPTPTLKSVGGTFDLARAAQPGSNEWLGAVTAARVATRSLPWEGVPLASVPADVPFGYLADLIVTTRADPEPFAVGAWAASAVASALDFDGTPQLGWEPLGGRDWAATHAETHVEAAGQMGLLSLDFEQVASGGAYTGVLRWAPGPMRERQPVAFELRAPNVGPHRPLRAAIATMDVTGSGKIDVVVAWSDIDLNSWRVVGRDLDVAARTFRGGWTAPQGLSAGDWHVPSFAAAGPYLFSVSSYTIMNPSLSIATLGSDGAVLRTASVDLTARRPGQAIVAADFGGGTGIDLLFFSAEYLEQGDRSAWVGRFSIAFDVTPDGRIGRWSESHAAPIPIAGPIVDLQLGAASAATVTRRDDLTSAFRAAAVVTQARQERLAAVAAPPAPAPAVDAGQLALDAAQGIDPGKAIQAAIAARLALESPIPATVTDPLQPLALTPRFPYPTFELLRDAYQERLLPGASRLPQDRAAVLAVNRPALEAFLVGLNHEMSRELLWREFPVRHGTFFSRFWDGGRDDLSPIERWDRASALGAHAPGGVAQPSLLLVVRAELLRRIPDAIVYAVPAKPGAHGGRTPDLAGRTEPLFSGRLPPDLRFFAFDLTPRAARGTGPTDGWYFVFQEHPTAPRFGLDEADQGFGTRPRAWSELEWPQVAASEEAYRSLVHLDAGPSSPLAGVTLPDGGASTLSHRWGFSAAHMAHITLQRPVLVAIHGSDLIDAGVAP